MKIPKENLTNISTPHLKSMLLDAKTAEVKAAVQVIEAANAGIDVGSSTNMVLIGKATDVIKNELKRREKESLK